VQAMPQTWPTMNPISRTLEGQVIDQPINEDLNIQPEPDQTRIRWVKWVGEPSILFADGFRVANWKHENRRIVAALDNATRTLNHKKWPGLSRTYRWGGDPSKRRATMDDMIQPVIESDWELIKQVYPYEFVDVTDHPHPELVENEPIIVHKDPGGRWIKSR
jgi:hypothetical protein